MSDYARNQRQAQGDGGNWSPEEKVGIRVMVPSGAY